MLSPLSLVLVVLVVSKVVDPPVLSSVIVVDSSIIVPTDGSTVVPVMLVLVVLVGELEVPDSLMLPWVAVGDVVVLLPWPVSVLVPVVVEDSVALSPSPPPQLTKVTPKTRPTSTDGNGRVRCSGVAQKWHAGASAKLCLAQTGQTCMRTRYVGRPGADKTTSRGSQTFVG